jgi:pyruvate, water dikinase
VYIHWLHELDRTKRAQVGGKSANLGELIRAGFPVPPGFAVTAAALERFLDENDLRATIDAATESLSPDDLGALEAASRRAREIITEAPLAADLEAALAEAWAELAERSGAGEGLLRVAVRSSAVAEDSEGVSFAGQHETSLGVSGAKSVARCLRLCWASLYTASALSYRARARAVRGPALPASMAVAVQQMVDASVAGVMLTCSPVSGDRSIVAINAGFGLGAAVVNGEITPDELWVDKVSMTVVRRRLGLKGVEYVAEPAVDGVVSREVPEDRRGAPCLRDEEILELAALGVRIERHYGATQDIEWAMDPKRPFPDNLVVLQSRPETAWSRRQSTPREAAGGPIEHVVRAMLGRRAVSRRP